MWVVQCLSHKAETKVDNRSKAWTTSSHPAEFCAKCKAIASGKSKKIEKGNKVEIPTSKGKATPTGATQAPNAKATTTKRTTARKSANAKA